MVVDLLGQSGLAAHLYRRIPIIALSIFCPPRGGKGGHHPPPHQVPLRLAPTPKGLTAQGPGLRPSSPPTPKEQGGTMYLSFPSPA